MASCQSLLPSFLYDGGVGARGAPNGGGVVVAGAGAREAAVVVGAPSEPPFGKIDMFSPAYYATCGFGGAAACGLTHSAVTPLDVIKGNIQIDPAKYRSTSSAFGVVMREQGVRGFFRGWAPTFVGYSVQGAFKYGLYELFKKEYTDMAGSEYAAKYKTLIYLTGSATAEVAADVALCPMEAVKVRVQTQPGYARGLRDGFPKIVSNKGYAG
ncbi:hypothetical protein GUJ93_ZPchr0002g24029 [Zizania palustris]|uniref:Uncharacterized protein n=1 Tax=Zizania palustris TaxID=103762 RepID=A0A8J5SFP0_ZIZPA|nr:hypothetical protein GUJ93_ZPchr0002g24029 [Zizania palustris]